MKLLFVLLWTNAWSKPNKLKFQSSLWSYCLCYGVKPNITQIKIKFQSSLWSYCLCYFMFQMATVLWALISIFFMKLLFVLQARSSCVWFIYSSISIFFMKLLFVLLMSKELAKKWFLVFQSSLWSYCLCYMDFKNI